MEVIWVMIKFFLAQEARVQMLRSMGYSELDVEGPGIIMNEAEIKYVKEAFAGDILTVDLHVGNFFSSWM